MSKQAEYSKQVVLSQEYAQAASGLAATACSGVLHALRDMTADPSALRAISQMHLLNDHARRIHDHLLSGERKHFAGDIEAANLEWAGALVLMDTLSLEALNIMDCERDELIVQAVELQKSGKTG